MRVGVHAKNASVLGFACRPFLPGRGGKLFLFGAKIPTKTTICTNKIIDLMNNCNIGSVDFDIECAIFSQSNTLQESRDFTALHESADRKRGQWKGATSKSVKK